MMNDPVIERERALRRIRLLVERVEQDCSLRHPEICRMRASLESITPPMTHADIVWLLDVLHCTTANCPGTAHCAMLRSDLENELKEFDS
jgi:hypothetical protein